MVLFNHVRDELKTYLYYYNIYGHQTRQGGDIPWRALNHKVTCVTLPIKLVIY